MHRLGRTARAGKAGAGVLLLADFEARAMLRELKDAPLVPAGPSSTLTGGTGAGLPGLSAGAEVARDVPASAELAAVLGNLGAHGELLREGEQAYVGEAPGRGAAGTWRSAAASRPPPPAPP